MAKEAPQGKGIAGKTTQKKVIKPAAKVATKKAPAKGSKKRASRGDKYSCEVCGLVVSVDEACGCVESHAMVCCGKEMKAGK